MAALIEVLKVYEVDVKHIVHAPAGRGVELQHHLASHGIESAVSSLAEADFDRLELADDADPVTVQAILDNWER